MQIQLCKKSLARLGAGERVLLSALRDREHAPLVKDCLDRCTSCDLGMLLATADGMPMSVKTADQLLAGIDTLAAEADE